MHLVRAGELDASALALVLANMRDPTERRGDLLAQWAANRRAQLRLGELASEHGSRRLTERGAELIEWTARRVADFVRSVPRVVARASDVLDAPGGRGPAPQIVVALQRRGRELVLDFTGTSAQLGASLNATRAVTDAAVAYVVHLLLPPGTPINEGSRAGVRIVAPPGTLVHATYPAPVAAGNVETSQRIVDTLLRAFAQWWPERIPAASSGTMSNLSFGGEHAGRRFAYYETIAGGAGASPAGDGAHAVHTHMTNTRNTPLEELERRLPVRVTRYTVRRGSGGAGARLGGDGVERSLTFLVPANVAWIADRTESSPWGLAGGGEGARGSAAIITRGRRRALGGRATLAVAAGAELVLATPGGGGHGKSRRARTSLL
jgi:N-methylhydantoinase B